MYQVTLVATSPHQGEQQCSGQDRLLSSTLLKGLVRKLDLTHAGWLTLKRESISLTGKSNRISAVSDHVSGEDDRIVKKKGAEFKVIMPEEESDSGSSQALLFVFLILLTGKIVGGDSLERDKQVLLSLKSFLEDENQVNRGIYSQWNQTSSNPCDWSGISCSSDNGSVTGIDLSGYEICGEIFGNFSALAELSSLDLSQNTLNGKIPNDLNGCRNLKYLNLSHNLLEGQLNLTGLTSLEILDLSLNRFQGEIGATFAGICSNLKVVNISTNNFTGQIDNCFDRCWKLQELDLSANNFTGQLWTGFDRLHMFSVSGNKFYGLVHPSLLSRNCSLQILDLSENQFYGEIPGQISNCIRLSILNLWGNNFVGRIPSTLGSVSSLEALILGSNKFSRDIPKSLLNCKNLEFFDLSNNRFGGQIPEIFGKFTQLRLLILHRNSFTEGINSSGILNLPNISGLDLSFNNFSGPLPVEISKMVTMQYLVLASNQFSGPIPSEYGSLPLLQALDLSFNRLWGSIPPSFGNLTSLLWLMLANNSLTGQIPTELGNCSSLLWLNLANNQLNGTIPPKLTMIGLNPWPTFLSNRKNHRLLHGSGECLAMRRWIPADYPPFSFVYKLLTAKSCRSIWDRLLKGYGLFPICLPGTSLTTLQISGYLQLSGNRFSGEIPPEIGRMHNFSMLHLGFNQFEGALPPDIERLPLMVLNVSRNNLSGAIPARIGNIKCLEILDLSYNNFSGTFPLSLNGLTGLSKFNVSFNQFISGRIPSTGQLATFDKESFLGDPHLELQSYININDSTGNHSSPPSPESNRNCQSIIKQTSFFLFLILTFAVLICGVLSILICVLTKSPDEKPGYSNGKSRHNYASSSNASAPWLPNTVKVLRLDKTTFTHADILKATGCFSEDRVIGRGGFGTVYKGVLPDGRAVAVKKLQRGGFEGEREFRAEMEVLSGNGSGWPHPNLVTLYGWCLDGSDKILVYEFMEGGSIEDLIPDRARLTWNRRLEIAIDVARALVFLHHECYPAIVHRDVKASNILLDKNGKAHVTDFGLARVVDAGYTHVSTTVAGTVGYIAPEYGQTWQATTKGDVYSFGVLAMELATGRRALDGGEECLVEWVRRGMVGNVCEGLSRSIAMALIMGSGLAGGVEEMGELLGIGIQCTAEVPQARPNMKEVLSMLVNISSGPEVASCGSPPA
ncbi:hypothetical protein Nepgr_003208 [Nepenthes gracilis]|uniref:non-specific serine/threonine protein kinase n=1 Tax=Nepenthes gracilis TaxID=150966 RepID=A0AAD3RZ71_NEPGR|nr:hypothetical protein Nepgr_003208 [Nepenthes gracilis]